ncbi:serine hydrolase FSH [Mrakia frigida]|uniref:alpha/beta hydrolase n=1 Tax=Mrakia frigida TaxID=29902 RepID=UPI003FCBF243
MLRILALPGYTQNAYIMSKRLGALRKGCGKDVEFVFIDPPHIVLNPSFGGSLADFDSTAASTPEEQTPENTPRSWWEAGSDGMNMTYVGFDETVQYLREVLDKDEKGFDGVFGFSQGAGMAAILASILEKPSLHPAFAGSSFPPFKFAIFAGGFLPVATNPTFEGYFPIEQTPTLHIIGNVDVIIGEARSLALVENCHDARIERHDGGHFVPAKASFKNFLKEYITSFEPGGLCGDVPPPKSAPPSAVPTPIATPRSGSPAPASK